MKHILILLLSLVCLNSYAQRDSSITLVGPMVELDVIKTVRTPSIGFGVQYNGFRLSQSMSINSAKTSLDFVGKHIFITAQYRYDWTGLLTSQAIFGAGIRGSIKKVEANLWLGVIVADKTAHLGLGVRVYVMTKIKKPRKKLTGLISQVHISKQ